ncbi:MAG: hypothetical protein Ct9H300mP1_07320 [Planctomycetaceae bacterium]|nr:MAG: hypothetical protein Ct9H300mP1_07320 [Planctomycetaceae bacterium]
MTVYCQPGLKNFEMGGKKNRMRILSDEQMQFWHDFGFVVVHDAVPPENLQAVIDAIWAFQEMDPENPDTWYRRPDRLNGMPELNGSGMVEMYNHPGPRGRTGSTRKFMVRLPTSGRRKNCG